MAAPMTIHSHVMSLLVGRLHCPHYPAVAVLVPLPLCSWSKSLQQLSSRCSCSLMWVHGPSPCRPWLGSR